MGLALFFVWELVVSSVQVAWDVMTPTLRARPGIVEIPLDAGRNVLKLSVDGQLPSRIATDSDRDFFMSAEEAQEYGLVDKVIESRSEIDTVKKDDKKKDDGKR